MVLCQAWDGWSSTPEGIFLFAITSCGEKKITVPAIDIQK